MLYECCINVLYVCCIFCAVFLSCMKLSLPLFFLWCLRVVKKVKIKNIKQKMMCCIAVLYFSACVSACYIFPRVESPVIFLVRESVCLFFCVWNFLMYFNTCGISCYIFPCVEFHIIFFYMWNVLWYSVSYFSVCGISSYIFTRVERALLFRVTYTYLDFL